VETEQTNIICEYCGAPIRRRRDRDFRLKYHPACKRAVDRARHWVSASTRELHKTCEWCSKEFIAKRSSARFCSTRCRTAHHRAKETQ
jgi:hypothetical protein